jgi:hypothetical protein
LLATYFVEAGLLLAIAPWTVWWRRNFFAVEFPWLRSLMAAPAVHYIVVIAGVATAAAGLFEIRSLFSRPVAPPLPPPTETPPKW